MSVSYTHLSKGKTTDALKGLMRLAPKHAVVLRNGTEETVSIEQVKKGDVFLVRPGENIPVDGIVLEGNSAVNEAALTGESIPADKKEGDLVSAATMNQSGFLKCEATRVGEDTTLSQIIQMVSDCLLYTSRMDFMCTCTKDFLIRFREVILRRQSLTAREASTSIQESVCHCLSQSFRSLRCRPLLETGMISSGHGWSQKIRNFGH